MVCQTNQIDLSKFINLFSIIINKKVNNLKSFLKKKVWKLIIYYLFWKGI